MLVCLLFDGCHDEVSLPLSSLLKGCRRAGVDCQEVEREILILSPLMLPGELTAHDSHVYTHLDEPRPIYAFGWHGVVSSMHIVRLHSRRDRPAVHLSI